MLVLAIWSYSCILCISKNYQVIKLNYSILGELGFYTYKEVSKIIVLNFVLRMHQNRSKMM